MNGTAGAVEHQRAGFSKPNTATASNGSRYCEERAVSAQQLQIVYVKHQLQKLRAILVTLWEDGITFLPAYSE